MIGLTRLICFLSVVNAVMALVTGHLYEGMAWSSSALGWSFPAFSRAVSSDERTLPGPEQVKA